MRDLRTGLRALRVVLWGLVFAAALGLIATRAWRLGESGPTQVATAVPGGDVESVFSLIDHRGRPVTERDFDGKWLLVFFGYTNCPDVCPTTLNTIAEVMDRLGRAGRRVQPLFISIDPERDTPAVMAKYVAAFDPRIVGLTGTPEQIKAVAGSFRTYYEKVAEEGAPNGYLMDHSAFIYFMRPDGRFETMFDYTDGVDEIVADVRRFL